MKIIVPSGDGVPQPPPHFGSLISNTGNYNVAITDSTKGACSYEHNIHPDSYSIFSTRFPTQ